MRRNAIAIITSIPLQLAATETAHGTAAAPTAPVQVLKRCAAAWASSASTTTPTPTSTHSAVTSTLLGMRSHTCLPLDSDRTTWVATPTTQLLDALSPEQS